MLSIQKRDIDTTILIQIRCYTYSLSPGYFLHPSPKPQGPHLKDSFLKILGCTWSLASQSDSHNSSISPKENRHLPSGFEEDCPLEIHESQCSIAQEQAMMATLLHISFSSKRTLIKSYLYKQRHAVTNTFSEFGVSAAGSARQCCVFIFSSFFSLVNCCSLVSQNNLVSPITGDTDLCSVVQMHEKGKLACAYLEGGAGLTATSKCCSQYAFE